MCKYFYNQLKFNKIGGLGDRLKQTNYNKTKDFNISHDPKIVRKSRARLKLCNFLVK